MFRSAHLEMAIRFTRMALIASREGYTMDRRACLDSAYWHLSFVREGK